MNSNNLNSQKKIQNLAKNFGKFNSAELNIVQQRIQQFNKK